MTETFALQPGLRYTAWERLLPGPLRHFGLNCRTPAVFYAEEQVNLNCTIYEKAVDTVPSREFRYAVKSCPLHAVLRTVASFGWGADCQSLLEVQLALRSKIPAQRISLCSPLLRESDIAFALREGVIVIADSPHQLELIAKHLQVSQATPNWHLGARLSLDVSGTERFHSKLGMELHQLQSSLQTHPILHRYLSELHHHGLAREAATCVPSGIVQALMNSVLAVEAQLESRVSRINIGGGFEPESILRSNHDTSTATLLHEILNSVPRDFLHERTVVLEPGRAITKDAALALTRVVNVKELRKKKLAVVDIATNLLIPLPLAEFYVDTLPGKTRSSPNSPVTAYDVVDGTCSPAGVIVRDALLPVVEPEDTLVVSCAGAYTWSLAEPFYDYLPELWWIAVDDSFNSLFSAQTGQEWTRLVWG